MVTRTTDIITRQEVQKNTDTLYLFGDNFIRRGFGGQAKEMRGESNAVGICTKRYPSNNDNAFLNDNDYAYNCVIILGDINDALSKYKSGKYKRLVIPPIGIGLAKLPEKAPKTYSFLQDQLDRLEREILPTQLKLF